MIFQRDNFPNDIKLEAKSMYMTLKLCQLWNSSFSSSSSSSSFVGVGRRLKINGKHFPSRSKCISQTTSATTTNKRSSLENKSSSSTNRINVPATTLKEMEGFSSLMFLHFHERLKPWSRFEFEHENTFTPLAQSFAVEIIYARFFKKFPFRKRKTKFASYFFSRSKLQLLRKSFHEHLYRVLKFCFLW